MKESSRNAESRVFHNYSANEMPTTGAPLHAHDGAGRAVLFLYSDYACTEPNDPENKMSVVRHTKAWRRQGA